ncbi:hypothetical protein LZ30DRAFT_684948 [Colletotrichum cereale]|nr:hypothetical protein LZ30DRAFT_684948 [Colletotrichum cereale]
MASALHVYHRQSSSEWGWARSMVGNATTRTERGEHKQEFAEKEGFPRTYLTIGPVFLLGGMKYRRLEAWRGEVNLPYLHFLARETDQCKDQHCCSDVFVQAGRKRSSCPLVNYSNRDDRGGRDSLQLPYSCLKDSTNPQGVVFVSTGPRRPPER